MEEEKEQLLASMFPDFQKEVFQYALKKTSGNVEAAVDVLLSGVNMEDVTKSSQKTVLC